MAEFLLWNASLPNQISTFTISNCETLLISFRLFTETPQINLLRIKNVATLKIIPDSFARHPKAIILEEIANVENLKINSFRNLNAFVLNNVTVRSLERNALVFKENHIFFRIENCVIEKIKFKAIQILASNSTVHIIDSKFNNLQSNAIEIFGDKLFVLSSKFFKIHSNAFTASLNQFSFYDNLVEVLHSKAFSISSKEMKIEKNYFKQIKSKAFRKFSFGPNSTYTFTNNFISFVEPEGFDLNTSAISTILISNNSFYCTCELFEWIKKGGRKQTSIYNKLLESNSNNVCANINYCLLPIKAMRLIFEFRKNCTDVQFDQKRICEDYEMYRDFKHNFTSNRGCNFIKNCLSFFILLFLYFFNNVV